ncbi:MAG: 16S rRNA (cytosine(1402)-N(4))-methyltransferase RsmH [Pseudomonadota bacterium]
MAFEHTSAMPEEVARHLACAPGMTAVDGTVGGAGHAAAICRRISPGGIFIGVDRDIDAIKHAKNVLEAFQDVTVHLVHDTFANLKTILHRLGLTRVDRILLDLGVSLHQLKAGARGFSFTADEPLDMRMDVRQPLTAADLVNDSSQETLADILWRYGEERHSRRIARQIVESRSREPITTAAVLADIVSRAAPRPRQQQRLHPATRTFMALRIAVNEELIQLEGFMDSVPDVLQAGGRLCVLSFHSLEDRIVKHAMKTLARACVCPPELPRCTCGGRAQFRLLTRRTERPSDAEIHSNPAARSTRLRAIERLSDTEG